MRARRKRSYRIAYMKISIEDEQTELERIKSRYERITIELEKILKTITNKKDIIANILELKAEGFLDWHILQGITSVFMNHYLRENGYDYLSGEKGMFGKIIEDMTIVDNYEFKTFPDCSVSEIKSGIAMSMLSVAHRHGLEPKIGANLGGMDATIELIKKRCPFLFKLDVPHDFCFD